MLRCKLKKFRDYTRCERDFTNVVLWPVVIVTTTKTSKSSGKLDLNQPTNHAHLPYSSYKFLHMTKSRVEKKCQNAKFFLIKSLS